MTQIETFQNSSFKVECICVKGEPWFKGKDVAMILGYANTAKAILNNVDDDDKKKLEEVSKGLSDSPLDLGVSVDYLSHDTPNARRQLEVRGVRVDS